MRVTGDADHFSLEQVSMDLDSPQSLRAFSLLNLYILADTKKGILLLAKFHNVHLSCITLDKVKLHRVISDTPASKAITPVT